MLLASYTHTLTLKLTCCYSFTHRHTHTRTHTDRHKHSLTLMHTHAHTPTLSLSHSLTHSLTLPLSLSLSHSHRRAPSCSVWCGHWAPHAMETVTKSSIHFSVSWWVASWRATRSLLKSRKLMCQYLQKALCMTTCLRYKYPHSSKCRRQGPHESSALSFSLCNQVR